MSDDDEEPFGGLYEDGHWIWDDVSEALVFVSDLPPRFEESTLGPKKAVTGAVEFRDDVDLIEQIRYRRRYQRKIKPEQADIITLQDVKDIAIYTAPVSFLSPMLINMLHLPTTERFLRAMILYMAYFLQVSEIMTNRVLELETKVRTLDSEVFERNLQEDVCDLRVLAAKEYATMLVGGSDVKKYHHMGASKKQQSLSDKDARLYEGFIRMCVQIIWLALGRKNFNVIELEVNRVFKSETFNSTEHNLKTGYMQKMSPEEYLTMFGKCLRHDKKLTTCSPLMNDVFCERDIDFRTMGLGVIKYQYMSNRLMYMWAAIAAKEEELTKLSVVLGIIGLPRKNFDTMLRLLRIGEKSKSFVPSSISRAGTSRKSTFAVLRLYPEIVLPRKSTARTEYPTVFPDTPAAINPVSETQRRRWIKRYIRLTSH